MRSINAICHTNGSGYWSNRVASVRIIGYELGYVDSEDGDFGELCVYFDEGTWDVNEDGLIYTDDSFLADLRLVLNREGLTGSIEYSEQGMQGEDYVSFDVDGEFIRSYMSSRAA